MRRTSILYGVALMGLFSQCNTSSKTGPAIQVWQTKTDRSKLLTELPSVSFAKDTMPVPVLAIDSATQYQSMEGFGAALTGSSAYVLHHNIDSVARRGVLKELFTKAGIGIDYIRLTIGASDFSAHDYSYDDSPGDTMMAHFSIDMEKTDLLPVLKEIIAVNPHLKILASPWSAPAWMKTSGSMEGGHLKPACYEAYARYFVKYIEAMKAAGIPIDAITIQNEPLYGTATYPCMFMFAPEQRDFIKYHLGPLFRKEHIDTKIILYDHNWDRPLYADTILNDPVAAQYVDGTAFHGYGGEVSAMGQLHDLHPDKNLYFTELSGGGWAPDFGENILWFTENIIIGTVQNWSRNALLWNLALDEKDGPKNNGCPNCRGVVTVATNGVVTKNQEYYILGQVGKFVREGARRCATSDLSANNIKNVGFINPDGSKVLLVLNKNKDTQAIKVRIGDQAFTYSCEGNSVYTFYWK